MFKSKKKPGKFKEKVVFKFQFHLTRVPQAGWDKLKVSVIPLNTGKASNKTTKAFVQYGTCRWPDPIVEAAKLYLDINSGRYDDKFYKLVVGSRSKLLGEVTINLAEYVNSSSSNLVTLPLKNCQGNTILHAKIHSLTSIRKSREHSIQDDPSSDSEDDLEDNSVESSTNQAPTPTSTRDNMSAPCYSSDALPEPLTPNDNGNGKDFYSGGPPSPSSSVTGKYERRRGRFNQNSVSSVTSERQLPRSSSAGLPFPPGHSGSLERIVNGAPKHSRSFSMRSNSLSERDFASTEKTGEGLRMEAVTWQRRAQNLGLEVQRLKQELNELLKQRVDQRTEEEILEKLKLELQSAKQAHEDNEESTRKEVEEYKRSVRELKAELGYEKEANVTANMQLRKAQESNMQLVLAIKDMEESLEEQRKEMEDLSSLNNKLETSLLDAKLREQRLGRQWSEKLSAKEEIIKSLQEKLVNRTKDLVTEGPSRLEKSTEDVKEMERELKELTEENMELIYKLNKVTKELDEKDVLVAEADPEEMERLKGMVNELEKKLTATEEFHQTQHASNEKLMVRLQTLIHGLKSANADLESQLRSSDDDINNLSKQFEYVKSECAAYEKKIVEQEQLLHKVKDKAANLEDDYASACRTITDSEAELGKLRDKNASALQEQRKLEVSVDDLNSQKADLECQAAKSLAQIQKHENEIAELLHELGSKLSHITDLQARILQLEMLNSGLDMKMQDSQELDKLNKSRISELELHMSGLIEELQSLNEYKQELESKAQILETERDQLSSQLKSEQENNSSLLEQVDGLVSQLSSAKAQLDQHVLARATLEENVLDLGKFKQDLEVQVERLRIEITGHLSSEEMLEARIKELEESLSDGEKCLENLKQEHTEAIAGKISLEAQVVELACKLSDKDKQYLQETEVLVSSCNAQKEKALKAEDLLETACQEKERLQLELQGLSRELATVREKKEKLSVEFLDMQIEKSLLEDMFIQMQKHSEKANAELESSRTLYERELKEIRSELEESNQKYAELTTQMDDAMDIVTSAKTKCESKLAECVKEILLSKSDKEKLIQENCELKAKVLELDLLATELHELKETLLDFRQEKSALELSIQEVGEEKSRLQEQSSFFKEQLDELKGTFANISQEKSALEEEKLRLQEQGTNFEEQLGELKATLCNVIQEKSALELNIQKLEEEKSKESTFFEKQAYELQATVLNVTQEKSTLEFNIQKLEADNSRLQVQNESFEKQFNEVKANLLNVSQDKSLNVQKPEKDKPLIQDEGPNFEEQSDEFKGTLLNMKQEVFDLDSIQNLEEEKSRLQGQSASFKQQLDELKATLLNVSNEKSALEQKVQKLQEENSRLQKQSTFFESKLEILRQSTTAKLTERRATIQAKLESFRAELDARLVLKREQLNEDGVETKQKKHIEDVLMKEIQHLEQASKQEEIGLQEETSIYAKLAFLEAQLTKEDEVDALKRGYQQKEATLQNRIEHLETTIETGETGLEQELTRLQEQLSLTSQRERELLLRLGTHELLEKEVRRLQQVNEQLENTITRIKASSAWNNPHDRILMLETELTEAMEANVMYKSQLQRAFGVQQHVHAAAMHNLGSIDQIISDLLGYKRKSSELGKELKEMHDRYSEMSLKFAEIVAEKEELLMTHRSLQRSSEVIRKNHLT